MEKRLSIIAGVVFLGYLAQFCLHILYNWQSFSSQYRIDAGGLAAASLGLMVQLWYQAKKTNWSSWMVLACGCIAFAAAMHLSRAQ